GNLLFLGCQAFFDDVDKKLSNDFSLWYNGFEKGIERQLNPPYSFPSVFEKRPQTVSQTI
ncbi:TPA: hypothetical protein ACGPBD_002206, partial [Streptococcus suis]